MIVMYKHFFFCFQSELDLSSFKPSGEMQFNPTNNHSASPPNRLHLK